MRKVLLTALVVLLLAASASPPRIVASAKPPSAPDPAELSSIVASLARSTRLDDLHWPDFSDQRSEVGALYQPLAFAPIWTINGSPTPQAVAVVTILANADLYGLAQEDYDGPQLAAIAGRITAAAAPDEIARFDMRLTVSLMRFLTALHCGRVNPRRVSFAIPARRFPSADFIRTRILNATDIRGAISSLEPQVDGYRRIKAALANYLSLAKQAEPPVISKPAKPVKPGTAYSEAPALAARLIFFGDMEANTAVPERTYDGPLVEAVKRFQARHGLAVNGILDSGTVQQVNTPVSFRIRQLQLTLERWRWIPRGSPPLIVVNIPEFRLRAYDENRRVVASMAVIVGKAYKHKTPIFEDKLESVIIRPYWNVPTSILRNELLPTISRNPGYMASHNFEYAGEGRIRQRPGPANALGLLKFEFPNDYDVYLHGTPQQKLFEQSRRDFSHGCIRIQDPLTLATWVLSDDPKWTRERIDESTQASTTIRVPVHKSIRMLILYSTAVVDESGRPHFFADIYGHDAELERELAKGYPYPN